MKSIDKGLVFNIAITFLLLGLFLCCIAFIGDAALLGGNL